MESSTSCQNGWQICPVNLARSLSLGPDALGSGPVSLSGTEGSPVAGEPFVQGQFGVDQHPFATYFEFHQGYRVLTHSHVFSARIGE